jgi:hypothetical protein
MNRFIAIVASFALIVCLVSCGYRGNYEDGYSNGYFAGYSDAEAEMQYLLEEEFLAGYDIGCAESDDYDDGYDDGYNDGHNEVYGAIADATDYARAQTGWSVYEAWNNISIYNDGIDPYGYPLPTEEEYLQSIETLVIFCEYLGNAGLGG